ncbi:THAP-type domain-containing protein, partial [Aphis craccivora]
MKNISNSTLTKLIKESNISKSQSVLLKEIISATNWMILCLLFQIRSPSGECGFDNTFFKLLEKKISKKTQIQKKGVLMLDEIFLRTSINVNCRSLTYSGLEDFGGEVENKKRSTEQADHGLVFLWQSLIENVTQSIAVFASKGPVKGVDLAQLVIKAIMLLEKSGLEVVALVSDGASTNKTMYKTLGVSGKKTELKNFFENPYDETHKVFVLCDAPHTIKNIRNRLSQQKYLKVHPSQECISWDHYRYVLENDSKNMLKICPKISRHYIELNNLTKMNLKYATQVFSKSMVVGIQFYRAQMCYGLKNSLETQEFTLKMNNMFDAMN